MGHQTFRDLTRRNPIRKRISNQVCEYENRTFELTQLPEIAYAILLFRAVLQRKEIWYMEIDYMFIGNRIREIRMLRDVSQQELAERTGLSPVYVSYIETGSKKPSLGTIIKIAEAMNVTVDIIIGMNHTDEDDEDLRELDMMMADCSRYETNIILTTVYYLKKSLRQNQYLLSKKRSSKRKKLK